MGRFLDEFHFGLQFSPLHLEITGTNPFSCKVMAPHGPHSPPPAPSWPPHGPSRPPHRPHHGPKVTPHGPSHALSHCTMVNKGIIIEILDFELGKFLENLRQIMTWGKRIFGFSNQKKKF